MIGIYMFIFFIISLLLICFPIKVGDYYIKKDYLNLTSLNSIRGIACLVVVFHHISIQLGGNGILIIPANLGGVAVGIFFFCSGYGLMYNLTTKENYLKAFLFKRLIPILIPFWLSNILFLLEKTFIFHEQYSKIDKLEYLVGIKLIVGHDWYIKCIVLMYIIFFVIGKLFKKPLYVTIMMSIVMVVWKIFYYTQNNILYGEIIPFIIGIWFAHCNNDKLQQFVNQNLKRLLIFLGCLSVVSFVYISIIRWHIPVYYAENIFLNDFMLTICQNSFVLLIILSLKRIRIKNKFVNYIGGVSHMIFI